jgi:acetyltransferase-like isoleucine patch superfamily enzyme
MVVEKYYENVTMMQPNSISINDPKCNNRRFAIPANNGIEPTARCSIILSAGSDFSKLEAYLQWISKLGLPQNYEIIIINDSGLKIDHSQLLISLPALKVLNSRGVLNQSLLFDRGARAATGKYLLFVRTFINFDKLVLEESIRDIETGEQKVSISSNGNFLLVEKFYYAKAGGFAGLFGQFALAMRDDNRGPPANAGYFRNLYNDSILVKYGPGTFIDPEAIIDSPESVKIGSNCIIRKGVVIRPEGGEIIIEDNCVINHYCVFHGKGGIYLADWTIIAPHCGFYAQNHSYDSFDVPITKQPNTGKGIYLMGDDWIGAHSVICDDVTIGKGAIIGANSTVTKSMPMASIAAGTPARVIKKRYTGGWDFYRQERAACEGMPQQIYEHVRERARLIKELVEPQDSILADCVAIRVKVVMFSVRFDML